MKVTYELCDPGQGIPYTVCIEFFGVADISWTSLPSFRLCEQAEFVILDSK